MGKKRKVDVSSVPASNPEVLKRDTLMFADWVQGMKYEALSEKYEVSYDTVYQISKKYNWKKLRKELNERQFAQAIEHITDMTVKMVGVLRADLEKIMKEFVTGKRMLTEAERQHLRALLDRFLKERRLEDGKPTELATGAVQVELVLPPGVKDFGVIPTTGHNVTVVENEKGAEPEPKLDLDAVEDGLKDSGEEPQGQ